MLQSPFSVAQIPDLLLSCVPADQQISARVCVGGAKRQPRKTKRATLPEGEAGIKRQ
jgi:hypothetical protein